MTGRYSLAYDQGQPASDADQAQCPLWVIRVPFCFLCFVYYVRFGSLADITVPISLDRDCGLHLQVNLGESLVLFDLRHEIQRYTWRNSPLKLCQRRVFEGRRMSALPRKRILDLRLKLKKGPQRQPLPFKLNNLITSPASIPAAATTSSLLRNGLALPL